MVTSRARAAWMWSERSATAQHRSGAGMQLMQCLDCLLTCTACCSMCVSWSGTSHARMVFPCAAFFPCFHAFFMVTWPFFPSFFRVYMKHSCSHGFFSLPCFHVNTDSFCAFHANMILLFSSVSMLTRRPPLCFMLTRTFLPSLFSW
jgi:hypothetical protein